MTLGPPPTFLESLLAGRRRIVRDTLVVSVALVAATFLIPNRYTARTVLLPPSAEGDVGGMLSTLPGGIALSKAFGLEATDQTSLYLGVLRSDTVRDSLVRRFGLLRAYRERDVEKARRKLASHTTLELTNDGFVEVTVTERNRRLAADLANAYAAELDRFLRENSNSSASRRRRFLESRLASNRRDLAQAENALRDYQVRERMPAIGLDADRAAQGAGDLVAGKLAREVELGALENVARVPMARAEQLRNEIGEIDRQLIKVPPATTEMARLYREVKIQERVLLVLSEEYERARLLELKDIPTVQVVDVAHPPIQKSFPRRSLIGIAILVIVFAVRSSLAWAAARAPRPARA